MEGFKCQDHDLEIEGLGFGKIYCGADGSYPLEIIVSTPPPPRAKTLSSDKALKAYIKQKARRACPVLAIVATKDEALLCGPSGDNPPAFRTKNIDAAKQLCQKALSVKNRHAVIRYLTDALPLIESDLAGVRNDGFLSTHELNTGTRKRRDWKRARDKSLPILEYGTADVVLLEKLGYQMENRKSKAPILSTAGGKIAIALLLEDSESLHTHEPRFNDYIPREYVFQQAKKENLDWIILLQGDRLRLYSTQPGFGTSKKPPNSCFIECSLSLLSQADAGLVWLLFAGESLASGGSIYEIKSNSERYAVELAKGLRERVHSVVIPKLVLGVLNSLKPNKKDRKQLDRVYEIAIGILFRMLLVAYAEDRNYLPYATNSEYKKQSLKQKAFYLQEQKLIGKGFLHWDEISAIWQAMHSGNKKLGIPEYGGLILGPNFPDSLPELNETNLRIENKFFVPALKGLLLSEDNKAFSVVDFRSLSIRELGSIYEGALENEFSIAEQDLTLKNGKYYPASDSDGIAVRKGQPYIHNSSGARKSSGSYYTPEHIVDYLLDQNLEPALQQHIKKIRKLPDSELPNKLFDFSVADIAMGSGHFLVMAIDRIEKHFSTLLETSVSLRKLIQKLEEKARKNLHKYETVAEVNTNSILRRIIAYKCVYGVDINGVAVNLARLSVWLHTFVPGLPLFLLERNLVHGNSLVGVARKSDIMSVLSEAHIKFFHGIDISSYLNELLGSELSELGKIHFSSTKEVINARQILGAIDRKSQPIKKLFDLCANPQQQLAGVDFDNWNETHDSPLTNEVHRRATIFLKKLNAIHLPIAFPQVFASDNQGFDVVLGNPPWQKIKTVEDKFFGRYYPGLSGMPVKEQKASIKKIKEMRPDLVRKLEQETDFLKFVREAITIGPYPGIGSGDPDYYIAFAWRFLAILRKGGRMGIVMPRSILQSSGAEAYRKHIFAAGHRTKILTLENNAKWVFPSIHSSYTIALLSVSKSIRKTDFVEIIGHSTSYDEFLASLSSPSIPVPFHIIQELSEHAAIPIIIDRKSLALVIKMHGHAPLSLKDVNSWRARPARELDLTNDSHMIEHAPPTSDDAWPVYPGASFNIWNPNAGKNKGYAKVGKVTAYLQKKRCRPSRHSPHSEFPVEYLSNINTLPVMRARIAVRLVTRRTDHRTMIVALIPPKTVLASVNYFLFPRGDEKDEAYLLGILSSMPLDWYMRNVVETSITMRTINSLPIPRLPRDGRLWKDIVRISGMLGANDSRFKKWADKVGVACGMAGTIKETLINQLDALVAIAYDLEPEDVEHIYATFHRNRSYSEKCTEVLEHYRKWKTGGLQ